MFALSDIDISTSHNSAKNTHSTASPSPPCTFLGHGSGAATVLSCRDGAELKCWLVTELLSKQLETSSSVARLKEQESVVQWLERIWPRVLASCQLK